MKVGVLGTGFGAYHAELYSKIQEVEAIYVFGRKPEKLKELETKYGIHPVTSIDEIMENDEIDLIDICLPVPLHCEYAIQALEHNKHVLCETPVTYSVSEAIAMQNAKQKSGKQLMVDLFPRFEYPYEMVAKYVQSGEYGKLKKFQIVRNTPPIWGNLGPDHIVTDLMIHDIDFLSYILGKPKEIKTFTTHAREDSCVVSTLCTYDNAFAEINSSSMMPSSYPFRISYEATFEHAFVQFHENCSPNNHEVKMTLFTDDECKEFTLPEYDCYDNVLRYAVKMIQTTEKPINDISDAITSIDMALKIRDMIVK